MSMSAISVCLTVLVLSLHYRPSLGVHRRPPKFCRFLVQMCNKEDLQSALEISPADEAIKRVENNLLRYRRSMYEFGMGEDDSSKLIVHMNKGFKGAFSDGTETLAMKPDKTYLEETTAFYKNQARNRTRYQTFGYQMLPRMMTAVGLDNKCLSAGNSSARIQNLYEEIADAIDRLTSQYAIEADTARSLKEWQSLARAVDRILFWSFVIITLSSTIALLVVTPAVHNAILENQRQQDAAIQRRESLQAMVSGTGPELEAAIAASDIDLLDQQLTNSQTVVLTADIKDAPLPVDSSVIVDIAGKSIPN